MQATISQRSRGRSSTATGTWCSGPPTLMDGPGSHPCTTRRRVLGALLGLVPGCEPLAQPRRPTRPEHRRFRFSGRRRRGSGCLHVGRRAGIDGHRPRGRHRDLLAGFGVARREDVDPGRRSAAGAVSPVSSSRVRALGPGSGESSEPTDAGASVDEGVRNASRARARSAPIALLPCPYVLPRSVGSMRCPPSRTSRARRASGRDRPVRRHHRLDGHRTWGCRLDVRDGHRSEPALGS